MTTILSPPVADPSNQLPLSRYVAAQNGRRRYQVELSQNASVDLDIERYCVVRLDVGLYRALILFLHPGRDQARLIGCDGDRETLRVWLTKHGVPTVRIGTLMPWVF